MLIKAGLIFILAAVVLAAVQWKLKSTSHAGARQW